MSARRSLAVAAALLAVAGLPDLAVAHDFNPGVLSLVERQPGRFDLAWTTPVDSAGSPAEVEVVFPAGCRREAARLDCGDRGLSGEVWFTGMHLRRMIVVVVVRWRGGEREEHLVSGAAPVVAIRAPADPALHGAIESLAGQVGAVALALALIGALRLAGTGPRADGTAPGSRARGDALAGAVGVGLGALAAHLVDGHDQLGALAARMPLDLWAAAGAVVLARAALVGRGLGRARAFTAGVAGLLVGALAPWPLTLAAAVGAAWIARPGARALPSVLDRHRRAARLDRGMNQLAGALGAAALVGRALAALAAL